MGDPAILFVKPKAISPRDKKALAGAGVIVVETENVADVKLVRPRSEPAEISGSALLLAAADAIARTGAGACYVEIVSVMPCTPEYEDACGRLLELERIPMALRSVNVREEIAELEADNKRARDAIRLTDAEDQRMSDYIAEHHVEGTHDHCDDERF